MPRIHPVYKIIFRYWEIIFYIGYAAILAMAVLPGLKWGFEGHNAELLLTSIRIWTGQVPFRDFYPWYGPLYHYLLALFMRPLGNDLYASRLYLGFICPLLSMAVLILTLRNFGLPVASRLFALIASIYLELERIYYCGSLRPFLPVLLISWLYSIYRKRQKVKFLFILPGALLIFLFTPESGIYAALTSVFLVAAITFAKLRGAEKFDGLFYYAAGAVAAILIFAGLYLGTTWFKNYLQFVSIADTNLFWSNGLSMPNWRLDPELLLVFRLPFIYAAALAALAVFRLRRGRFSQYSIMVLTLTVLGIFMASRVLLRFHQTHFQFAYLPAIIIASLAYAPPNRPINPWKTVIQVLVIPFLAISRWLTVGPFLSGDFNAEHYKTFLGVRVAPGVAARFDNIQEHFNKLNAVAHVAIPLTGAEYPFLDRVPEFMIDDLHYMFDPHYQQLFLNDFGKRKYSFLIIIDDNISWDYTQDAVDFFFDYVDANYRQILETPPVRVYQMRERPVVISRVISEDRSLFKLDRSNNYSITLQIPDDDQLAYVELKVKFQYKYKFLSRLSMPIVQIYLDGKQWFYPRDECGRQRLNPLEGEHSFRAYLLFAGKTMNFQVTFPGMINIAPEQIIITDVKWCAFQLEHPSPRTVGYELGE
jgi:hypothetical protein